MSETHPIKGVLVPAESCPCDSCYMGPKVILIIGGGLMVLGVIMIPLPGPGALVLILGLCVLLTGVALSVASKR